jgi:hypothetical protein
MKLEELIDRKASIKNGCERLKEPGRLKKERNIFLKADLASRHSWRIRTKNFNTKVKIIYRKKWSDQLQHEPGRIRCPSFC